MPHRTRTTRSLLLLALLLLFATLTPATTKKPPARPININSATSAELQQVPGIGPSTADKILQMRKSYGAFKSVDDLKAIRGIGPKRFDKIHKYLTVGKSSPTQAKSPNRAIPSAATSKSATTAKPATLPVPQNSRPKPIPTDTSPKDDEESE